MRVLVLGVSWLLEVLGDGESESVLLLLGLGVGVTAEIDKHSVYVLPSYVGYVTHVVEGEDVALEIPVPLLVSGTGVDVVSEFVALPDVV